MLLPTTHCPKCKRDALVYQGTAPGDDPMTGPLHSYCVDCDTQLDRFGGVPALNDVDSKALKDLGYNNLDKPRPVAPAGCFETRGCEGCPKIDSRPW